MWIFENWFESHFGKFEIPVESFWDAITLAYITPTFRWGILPRVALRARRVRVRRARS